MDEKNRDTANEKVEDNVEVTELEDKDIEDVAGGVDQGGNYNCGC